MNKSDKEIIPSEFQDVSECFCSFYKVRSPLECEEEFSVTDKVVKCIILVTKDNTIIELENNTVKRIQKLSIKTTSKVIVHHEYDPLGRYIVLLSKDRTAHILEYSSLEEINSWNDVIDISSEDLSEEGKPKLILKKFSEGCETVKEDEFLVHKSSSAESGRSEAIVALNNKLKSVMWLAESVDAEKTRKEAFVCRKISDLSNQLQGLQEKTFQIEGGSELQNTQLASTQLPSTSTVSDSSRYSAGDSILKVVNTRQRIVHNKWVICVAIVNLSDRHDIRNPELVLHADKSLRCLHYQTRILKTYQKASFRAAVQEAEIKIEALEPPLLRPKKKAFLVAICEFPDFSLGGTLSCSGLITFRTSSSTGPGTDEDDSLKQVSFPPIQLEAKNLKPICADVIREKGSAGLSFELFALIAASQCNNVTVKSVASPLDQFVESLSKDSRIIKAEGLSNFYCFYVAECPPLHLASFSFTRKTAMEIVMKIYTKDDNQAIILLHNLKEFLPFDASISSHKSCSQSSTEENFGHKELLSNMQLVLAKIQDAYEQPRKGKIQKRETGEPSKTLSVAPTHEMSEKEYVVWRKDLSELTLKIEMLFQQRGE